MNNLLVSLILLMVCVGEWFVFFNLMKFFIFIVGSVSSLVCYLCADCPVPFNPYAYGVTQQASYTGYCAVSKLEFIN